MTEPTVWDWGFTYLCPECKTWESYHCPLTEPERLALDIGLEPGVGMVTKGVTAVFTHECGAEIRIPLGVVPRD